LEKKTRRKRAGRPAKYEERMLVIFVWRKKPRRRKRKKKESSLLSLQEGRTGGTKVRPFGTLILLSRGAEVGHT